jgi:CDGSH-type Zn-finger protein
VFVRGSDGRFLKGTHWRHEKPHWGSKWLHDQYVKQGRSTGDIAKDAGVTDAAILYWLKKHGIPRRNLSEARALKHWGNSGAENPMYGKTGDANPRYIDGSSPERQRLYVRGKGRRFIREILERDNYKCCRCGVSKQKPKSLHVHHIIPWAGNKSMRFCKENVVTLCSGCHWFVHSKKNTEKEFIA